MIYRLIILLLIVGCEEPSQHGCLDSQACNYDADATIDNNSCAYVSDCEGVCGGDAVIDSSGVCCGDGFMDECGICDGGGYLDCVTITECDTENICDESECIAKDCAGVCGGDNIVNFGCIHPQSNFLVATIACGNLETCIACFSNPESCGW